MSDEDIKTPEELDQELGEDQPHAPDTEELGN